MENLFYNKEYQFFIDKIKNNEHFKYSRFNDGELIAVIGDTPNKSNCDGHIYFPDMSRDLNAALLNYKKTDDYYLESFKYWYDVLPHIKNVLHQLKEKNSELTYLVDDFIRMTHEKDPNKFVELLEILKTKKLVIVGPDYLKHLSRFFEFKHIIVPVKNCYLEKDRIIEDINKIMTKESDNIFLFSASMATNVIIDKFIDDKNNTYLDWGSVWDTFYISPEFSFIRKRSTSNLEKYKEIYKDFLI